MARLALQLDPALLGGQSYDAAGRPTLELKLLLLAALRHIEKDHRGDFLAGACPECFTPEREGK